MSSATIRKLVFWGLLGLAPLSWGLTAHAQDAAADASRLALPDSLTPEAIKALLTWLSDDNVRRMLLQQLEAGVPEVVPVENETSLVEAFSRVGEIAESVALHILKTVQLIPSNLAAESEMLREYVGGLGFGGTLWLFFIFLAAVCAGICIELLVNRLILSRNDSLTLGSTEPVPLPAALKFVGRRLVRELAGICAFFLVGSIVLRVFLDGNDEQIARAIATGLIFLPRLGATLIRFFLAPNASEFRIVNTDDETARYLFRNAFGILVILGSGFTLLSVNRILGAAPDIDRLAFVFNLIVFVWIGTVFVQARAGLRMIVRGKSRDVTRSERWIVDAFPWFGVTVIVLTWLVSAVLPAIGEAELLRGGRHIFTLVILLLTPMLDTLIRAIVAHIVDPMRGDGAIAQRAYHLTLRSYIRMARVLVFGGVVLLIADIWDISLINVASAGVGAQLAEHLFRALLICVVGYVAWELTRLVINRKLANENTAFVVGDTVASAGPSEAPPSSRLATILPLISGMLQVAIIVLTALTALGNVGIDVTPLLAGAGIAGIAIGFGAQKLVSDIVSGLFFLIDDAFRLNEYIDVGGVQGSVERISLRSIQLRDSKGPILVIPYSNIEKVTNFGRDWGVVKLKFTVPFGTDVEKVRKIFKKIGQDMMQVPELAEGFIQPFKGVGVYEFNDVGIVVRGKFVHKPGAQFNIKREIFTRIPSEFAANGIQFARREVRVSVNDDGLQSPERMNAIGAAAAEAVSVEERARADQAVTSKS